MEMKKVLTLALAVLVLLLALGLTPLNAQAGSTINIVSYYATGGDGDWWEYRYTIEPASTTNPNFSSPFTVTQTRSASGILTQGSWILPDKSTTYYASADATHLYLYDASGNLVSTVDCQVESGPLIDSPFPGNEGMRAYFTLISSYTGTFQTFANVLVYVVLDTNYGATGATDFVNKLFGIDIPDSEWGLTHVSALARGIGEIINIDFDAESGALLWQYELAATSVQAPAPGTLVLLGSGLSSLVLFGRRKMTAKN
jgi:hypothetical protein